MPKKGKRGRLTGARKKVAKWAKRTKPAAVLDTSQVLYLLDTFVFVGWTILSSLCQLENKYESSIPFCTAVAPVSASAL